ncbi:hypothetical protein GCM10009844_07390 [Nocardioides koreensis]|uniref:Integral membrane protein n=1 Tax=Nocardioides koreensis TaxID=433651 RepID=A0ABN2Z9W8_9ACTN
MTTPPAPTRPRQVTMAAWLIMGGSVLVVLMVFERVAGLHSLETRESVQKFLAEPPGADLGLGVSGVLDLLRVLCMVAAGCATAAAILGYQVLRRSRSARLALTVLAVPLFVTGLATGGFTSSVVAASAVMLWFQPARDWFNGVVREPRPEVSNRIAPPAAPPYDATRPGPGPGPGPWPGPGPGGQLGDQFGDQAPGPALPLPAEADPTVRPQAVVWACVLTWLFAGLALVVMAASIAVLAASPDLVFDELHKQNPDLASQGVSDATLRTITFVVGGVVAAWSLAALVLAGLAFRRVGWARVALVVSASGAVVCLLLATVSQPLLIIPLAASVVTLALMVRPEVRAWFDR